MGGSLVVPRWGLVFVDGQRGGAYSERPMLRSRDFVALKYEPGGSHSDTSVSTTSSVARGCWSSIRSLAYSAVSALCAVKPVPSETAQSSIADRKGLIRPP